MNLYLIRHGAAEQHSASGRDADRLLTEEGRLQATWLGEAIRQRLDAKAPPQLLASGVTRAWQTAGLLSEEIGVLPVREPLLETGRSASDVLDVLARESNTHALLLVGHDPHFSEALSALGEGAALAQNGLRTGECAQFHTRDGALVLDGLLRWGPARN